jgi:hypothetical protein
MDRKLIEAARFFLKHAGYATPPGRVACALHLARAERRAEEMGIVRERAEYRLGNGRVLALWEYDTDGLVDREVQPGCEVLQCAVMVDGEWLASCGGIELRAPSFVQGRPRDPYIRVMQAELLAEAFAELDGRRGTAELMKCTGAA